MTLTAPFILADLTVDPRSFQVFRRSRKIPLRKKEYQLLEFMVINKNKVLNKLTILENVWNYGLFSTTNTLDVHIANLRRKIDKNHDKKLIQTVHGLGYRICDSD